MAHFKRRRALQEPVLCALFAALLCLLSPLSLPLGPIPLTPGLFAVFLTVFLLPPRASLTAMALFLALGACGLPVFSSFGGGFAVLFGPLGGYLWSYLLIAPIVGVLTSRRPLGFLRAFSAGLSGLVICYFCGTLWYAAILGVSPLLALPVTVLPFLFFDFLKLLLAAYLSVILLARGRFPELRT